jgi:hypothetical protein
MSQSCEKTIQDFCQLHFFYVFHRITNDQKTQRSLKQIWLMSEANSSQIHVKSKSKSHRESFREQEKKETAIWESTTRDAEMYINDSFTTHRNFDRHYIF